MLKNKWIFIMIFTLHIWADNNKTDNTTQSSIFSNITNLFISDNINNKEKNIFVEPDNKNRDNHPKELSCKNNNEKKNSNISNMFSTIINFFSSADTNNTNKNLVNKQQIKKDNNNDNNQNSIDKISKNILNKIDYEKIKYLDNTWHLRVIDGMDVRIVRVIIDFTIKEKLIQFSGFDGCNRIHGNPKILSENRLYIPSIISTKMACRGKIFHWASRQLHQTLRQPFDIKKEKRYGIEGITIKSDSHELFFKRMQRD